MAVTIIRRPKVEMSEGEKITTIEELLARKCVPAMWPFPVPENDGHVWNPQTFKCIRCAAQAPKGTKNKPLYVPQYIRQFIKGSAS